MDTFRSLVVPGTKEGLRAAEQEFDEFSAAHGLTRNDTWPFHVALDEILSNVIKYGFSGQKSPGRVEIELRLEAETFEMVILDDAPPFNPLEAARPDTSLGVDERPLGGLGIEIIRRLMDVTEYRREDDGRNRLALRRRLGL
jgi:anti-sigma regulatory factor (Ser/Thr protein kinase)